jgi:hypothetical protein
MSFSGPLPVQLEECAMSPPAPPRSSSSHDVQGTSAGHLAESPISNELLISPPSSSTAAPLLHAGPAGHGRGRHERRGKRKGWQQTVEDHVSSIPSLLTSVSCSSGCSGCDTASWVTLSIVQECAVASFGTDVLSVGKGPEYKWDSVKPTLRRNQEATANWFDMLFSLRVLDPNSGEIDISYRVQGRAVCQGVWRAFHGVPPATMDTMVRLIKQGQTVWNASTAQEAAMAQRHEHAYLRTAAEQWWCIRLDYYEFIVETKEGKYSGIIQHPHNIDWSLVYDDEFVPEMHARGLDWRTTDKSIGSVGSKSTWYEGRAAALQQLATDRVGLGAKPFLFQSRAKHSAYVSYICTFPVLTLSDTSCLPFVHYCVIQMLHGLLHLRKSALGANL